MNKIIPASLIQKYVDIDIMNIIESSLMDMINLNKKVHKMKNIEKDLSNQLLGFIFEN